MIYLEQQQSIHTSSCVTMLRYLFSLLEIIILISLDRLDSKPGLIWSSCLGFLQPSRTQYHTRHFHAWSWRNLKREDTIKGWDFFSADGLCGMFVLCLKQCMTRTQSQTLLLSHLYLPNQCSRSSQPASKESRSPLPSRGSWWHDRPASPLSHAGTHLQ